MNLPTYSLADSPASTILNVCLGVPPPSTTIYPIHAKSLNKLEPTSSNHHPSSNPQPPQNIAPSSIKGKSPAHKQSPVLTPDHHSSDDDFIEHSETEEPWQDAEFRLNASSSNPHRSSSSKDHLRSPHRKPSDHQVRHKPDPLISSSSSYSSSSSPLPSPPSSSSLVRSCDPNRLLNHTGWDENFTTANSEGWVIYGTYPLRVIDKHVIPNSSLKIVLPVHRTNILYLVGGPPSPLYSPNKVIVYDSSISKAVFSIELTSPVLGLTARKDKLVVVLINKVLLFNISTTGNHAVLEEGHWETCENPRGLVCLGSDYGSGLLVFPGRQSGKVQVVNLPPFQPKAFNRPQETSKRVEKRQPPYPSTSILVAHTTSLASLAITPSGNLIATASVTGTLIRIWDVKTSALLRELRRGTDGAEIWGLRFRPDGLAICASSDKGTIHVWSLTEKEKTKNTNDEGKSGRSLALLKPYLPKYFHSTWSDAFFRLPPPGPTPGRSMPNLFAGLPIGSTQIGSGESKIMATRTRAETTNNKPPTIEDDVSLVSWILANGPTMKDADSKNYSVVEPQIIALTRSGGWFRLRIPQTTNIASAQDDRINLTESQTCSTPNHHPRQQQPQRQQQQSSTTNRLGMMGLDRSIELECVEYRRFGENEDWSDDDSDTI